MSLNQQVIAEFSPCTPNAPQLRDLSIQTSGSSGAVRGRCAHLWSVALHVDA
jgi:hypothetical protein